MKKHTMLLLSELMLFCAVCSGEQGEVSIFVRVCPDPGGDVPFNRVSVVRKSDCAASEAHQPDSSVDALGESVTVGSWNEWVFTFMIDCEIAENADSLVIHFPYYYRYPRWTTPQTDQPTAGGFVSARSIHHRVPLSASTSLPWDLLPRIRVYFQKSGLRKSDLIRVRYGDRSGGGPGAQTQGFACSSAREGSKPFRFEIEDRSGDTLWDIEVPIDFTWGDEKRIRPIAPISVINSDTFNVVVRLEDELGNLVLDGSGSVVMVEEHNLIPGVWSCLYGRLNNGICLIDGVSAHEQGVYRFRVRDEERGFSAVTNPVVVKNRQPGVQRHLVGDLHVHTSVSGDASGGIEEVFTSARLQQRLDFVGTSNHGMDFSSKSDWREIRLETERQYDPGSFVTFLGFEWTSNNNHGHRNILFPDADGRIFPATQDGSDSLTELWSLLEQYGAVAIPHLPMPRGYGNHHQADWSVGHDRGQRLVEIYSQWTPRITAILGIDVETAPDGVQDAWRAGHRLGLVGGSDNHAGRPAETGGLTVVVAEELTRESIWNGLFARRCYATTGARIWLDFRLSGCAIGEVACCPKTAAVDIVVLGTDIVDEVQLVGKVNDDFRVERSYLPGCMDFIVEDELSDLGTKEMYYLRVEQADGHRAWSSPIWIAEECANNRVLAASVRD